MAACAAVERSPACSVTVFDASVPLATVLRTGGGRCNLTNEGKGIHELAACYPRGGKFLLSAFARFGPPETIDWFQARGLPLVTEEEGRVFPRSGRAEDVRRVLEAEARHAGVQVRARTPVVGLSRGPGAAFTLGTVQGTDAFDRVIVATGGDWRHPKGPGYSVAQGLGHSITPLAPSLSALSAGESWVGRLAGLTVRGARAAWRLEGEKPGHEKGDLLFTHGGISGPLAFRVSSRCAYTPISRSSPLHLSLQVHPGTHGAELEAGLIGRLADRPRQLAVTAAAAMVPRSLAEVMMELAGLDRGLPGAQLSRDGRKRLAALMASLPVSIVGRGTGTEMVTAGGVRCEEIDPRTMESRLVPGLFFCGEVLDVDGFTGGYNLQAAWSTGRIAGLAAGR
jgi:predicted Rossmann fold flavoprotein